MLNIYRKPNSPLATLILTTSQVAAICRVAPRTVQKWIDADLMPGSYRIPHSKDRRVPADALRDFMVNNHMSRLIPPSWMSSMLLVGLPDVNQQRQVEAAIRQAVGLAPAPVTVTATNGPVALAHAAAGQPFLVFSTLSVGREVLSSFAAAVRVGPSSAAAVYVVALVRADDMISPDHVPDQYPGVNAALDLGLFLGDVTDESVEKLRSVILAAKENWVNALQEK